MRNSSRKEHTSWGKALSNSTKTRLRALALSLSTHVVSSLYLLFTPIFMSCYQTKGGATQRESPGRSLGPGVAHGLVEATLQAP